MLKNRIEQDVPGCGCSSTTVPVFEKEAIRYDESLYKPPMVGCAVDVDYEEDFFIDYLRDNHLEAVVEGLSTMPNPTITHPARDNDQVDEANLQIRWNNISDVRFFVSIRNLTTDRVVVSNQETTTNSFTFQMAHLTPGNRFRVAVNAVEFGGSGALESTWAERVFVVRAISITSGRVVHSRIIQQPDSMGHNLTSERQLTAIDRIAVHHSASGTNHNPTITNINNWWIGHEWTRLRVSILKKISILVLMVPLALSGCFSDSRISESNRIPQNTLHNPVSLYLLTYYTNADDLKAGFNVFDAETLDFYHNFIMPSVNVFTSANKDPGQIIITTKRTVKDFRVLLIHFNDAKRLYVVDQVIFTLDELTPGIPLVLTGSTMGGSALAAEGFSFVDSYGITRYFAFHMSGYDGDTNPNVFEFDPAPDS